MQFYMAPMEGLTGYIFRNAYQKHYGGIDRYFTPFITNRKLNHRELQDVVPEHNAGMDVVPQILTNRAKDFLCIARELEKFGYRTVNLNLGCPSGTVVAKNRGADKGMADARVAQQAKTDETAQKERFLAFHDDILRGYMSVMSGDKNTLFKMKELWVYFAESFTNPGKYMKKIRKSERIAEYEAHVAALFREQELK